MDKNLLVQVVVATNGNEVRCGTAYPVAPNRLITAAHVVGDAQPEQIELSWYHQSAANRGWRPCTGIAWDGRPGFDVVVLACDFPPAVENDYRILEGINPSTDSRWESEGFPIVGQHGDDWNAVGLKGATFAMGDQSDLLELEADVPPDTEQGWQGASGSPVFVDGAIIGVIVNCPKDFKAGRLKAVPAKRLLDRNDEEFNDAIGLTENDKRDLLIKAAGDLLSKSTDALDALASEVNVSKVSDAKKWASAILRGLLAKESPPQILNSLVRSQRRLDASELTQAADVIERVSYFAIPAALTNSHVRQMQVIADSRSQRIQFQAKTKTFVEVAIARLNGRGTMYRPVSASNDLPSGKLCLSKPPEEGMDEEHASFISNFVAELGEMIGSDLLSEDQAETVRAINAELETQLDLDGWQYYYVFENPQDDATRRQRHELAKKLDEMFPTIALIGLDRQQGSREELDTVQRMMRILCRAAGIEYKPHGTN